MTTKTKFTIKEYEIMLLLASKWILLTNREYGDTHAYMVAPKGGQRTVHFPAVKSLIRKGYVTPFKDDRTTHTQTIEGFAALDEFIESRKHNV